MFDNFGAVPTDAEVPAWETHSVLGLRVANHTSWLGALTFRRRLFGLFL